VKKPVGPQSGRPPPTPETLKERIFRWANSANPPPGAGMLALAGWSIWASTVVKPRYHNHFIAAAGLFIVAAVWVNRITYILRRRREHEERERRKHDGEHHQAP